MKKQLTAILTAAALLGCTLPINAAAYGIPAYASGTYAVLSVKDGYTLLTCVESNKNESDTPNAYTFTIDAAGYLVENADLLSMLPEGAAQPVRGDLLTMTADYILYSTGETALGRDLYSVHSRVKNSHLRYDPGQVTPIGSVLDDPQYSYFLYSGMTAAPMWKAEEAVPVVNFKAYTRDEYRPLGGGTVPAECADDVDFAWTDVTPGDWVKMLTYNGMPLFPEAQPGMQDAAVVGISVQEDMTTYILSDGAAIVDSAESHPYQGSHPLQYGDMVRYRFPVTGEDFVLLEPAVMEYIAPAENYYERLQETYQSVQDYEVVSNADCRMELRNEDGSVCEYSYPDFINKDLLLLDQTTISPGEIWRFAAEDGSPRLPLKKVADSAAETISGMRYVITATNENFCMTYPYHVDTSFGVIQNVYFDTPVTIPTAQIVTCLGEMPENGDILTENGVMFSQTELWGINDGFLMGSETDENGNDLKEGMLIRTGNIFENNETGTFRVTGNGSCLFLAEPGATESKFHTWETLDGVDVNDVVTYYTFLGQPVIPISVADYKTGDTDNSGEIDIMDIITVNKALLGSKRLSASAVKAIDFNGNGLPDSEESLLLLKYVVGIVDTLQF